MNKLKLIRKTLTGTSEAFEFDTPGLKFLVKNFSGNDCLVNFEEITNQNELSSIKVPKETAHIILSNEYNAESTNKVYVKGTGEVEVQMLLW